MTEYNNNTEVGENPYEDYMVSLDDTVDTAVIVMSNRIKTRLAFLEIAGASKEKQDESKKKWIGDVLSFMMDKGIISNDAKESLLDVL